jgi:hypothetical protein
MYEAGREKDSKAAAEAQELLGANEAVTGIQFVTDAKGRKVAVLMDIKKHDARLDEFWDGLIY